MANFDVQALLLALRARNGSSTNPALRAALGWSEHRYAAAKADAIDEGLVIRGKGRGGTLSIPSAQRSGTPNPVVTPSTEWDAAGRLAVERDNAPSWRFRRYRHGDRRRDSTTDQHFQGDTPHDFVERLVREAIQNSLDAACDDSGSGPPVEVRIALFEDVKVDPLWFRGMPGHWNAVNKSVGPSGIGRWLVIEDFQTHGLYGDWKDFDRDEDSEDNPFQNFFFAEGISSKSSTKLGRFGLGKHVFLMAGHLRCFFAVSKTSARQAPFVMGQAQWKNHHVGKTAYLPDGYFGVRETAKNRLAGPEGVDVPTTDYGLVGTFINAFGLRAQGSTGTAIVVPAVVDRVADGFQAINVAVLKHFLPTIVAGRLVVTCEDREGALVWNAGSIKETSELLPADDRDALSLHAVMAMTEQWLRDGPPDWRVELAELGRASKWSDYGQLQAPSADAMEKWERTGTLAVRVEVPVSTGMGRSDAKLSSGFSVVFVASPAADRMIPPLFIRQWLVVPEASSEKLPGVHCLVGISESPLVSILSDAENPSHEKWTESELCRRRPDAPADWIGLLRIVKTAPRALWSILSRSSRKADETLWADVLPSQRIRANESSQQIGGAAVGLADMTQIAGEIGSGGTAADRQAPDAPVPQLTPAPMSSPTNVNPADAPKIDSSPGPISMAVRGREVVVNGRGLNSGQKVEVVFSILDAEGKSDYDLADFDLANEDTFRIGCEGGHVVECRENRVVVCVDLSEFELSLHGFEPHRDLLVRAEPLRRENAHTRNP